MLTEDGLFSMAEKQFSLPSPNNSKNFLNSYFNSQHNPPLLITSKKEDKMSATQVPFKMHVFIEVKKKNL